MIVFVKGVLIFVEKILDVWLSTTPLSASALLVTEAIRILLKIIKDAHNLQLIENKKCAKQLHVVYTQFVKFIQIFPHLSVFVQMIILAMPQLSALKLDHHQKTSLQLDSQN